MNVLILGHQETTREWWVTCRNRFELFVSALVVNEAAQGDAEAARLRLQALQAIPEQICRLTPAPQERLSKADPAATFPPAHPQTRVSTETLRSISEALAPPTDR